MIGCNYASHLIKYSNAAYTFLGTIIKSILNKFSLYPRARRRICAYVAARFIGTINIIEHSGIPKESKKA